SGASGGAARVSKASDGGRAAPSGQPAAAKASQAPPGSAGATPRPVGRQSRRLNFDDQSGVVPLARDFTRQALYAWGWLPAAGAEQRAAAEDVLLVVSELVTNACLHAEGPDPLDITCDNKVIRIAVTDRGTRQPAPRTAPAGPAATACSSSSGSAWTGASSARRAPRARPSGPNSARPPDPSTTTSPRPRRITTDPACAFPSLLRTPGVPRPPDLIRRQEACRQERPE